MAWLLRVRGKGGAHREVNVGKGAELSLEPGTSYELIAQGSASKPLTIKRSSKPGAKRQDLVAEQDGAVVLTLKDFFGADDGSRLKVPGGELCPQDGATLTPVTASQASSSEIVWSSGDAACAAPTASDSGLASPGRGPQPGLGRLRGRPSG